MPVRAQWKGWLKLSLVSCPIALYPAIAASERVSFRQVNRQTGNRLRQQLVDEVTGERVQSDDKARGYEVGERQYLLVEDSELDEVREEARTRPFSMTPAVAPAPPPVPSREPAQNQQRRIPQLVGKPTVVTPQPPPSPAPLPAPRPVENNHTIMIDRFIPRADIDTRYYDTPYYIAPRDDVGEEAFAVIRDAMAAKGVVGLARVVLARRERPILLDPLGKGLCGTTLRYAHEVRDAEDYFARISDLDLPEELIEVAEQIIEAKTASFDPGLLEDRYRTVLVETLKAKTAQLPVKARAATSSSKNVVDLMAMLKRSIGQEGVGQSKARTTPRAQSAAVAAKPRRAAAATRHTATKRSKPGKNG